MNTTTERHAIEARHPGWHVWLSDAGHPWATNVHWHAQGGAGVTLDAPALPRIEQRIAAFDSAVAHHFDPWQAIAS